MAIQILQGAGVGILQSLLAMLFLIPGIAKLFNYKVGTKKRMLEGCAQIVIAFFATTLISITLAVCGAWCGVIVPLVGLAYEKLRANNKCDCFGAISEVMEPWKNIYRAVLVATSAMLLAIYALSDISFMNQQSYIVGIFVSLLSGISALIILFSRQINSKLGLRGIIKAPVRNKFEPIQLEISTSLGENRLNETISISEFCVPNVPILIVFTSSTCTFCKPLKQDLSYVAAANDFPVRIVVVSDAQDEADLDLRGLPVFSDRNRRLQLQLGVTRSPAAAIIDAGSLTMSRPLIIGVDQIKALVGTLLIETAKQIVLSSEIHFPKTNQA